MGLEPWTVLIEQAHSTTNLVHVRALPCLLISDQSSVLCRSTMQLWAGPRSQRVRASEVPVAVRHRERRLDLVHAPQYSGRPGVRQLHQTFPSWTTSGSGLCNVKMFNLNWDSTRISRLTTVHRVHVGDRAQRPVQDCRRSLRVRHSSRW